MFMQNIFLKKKNDIHKSSGFKRPTFKGMKKSKDFSFNLKRLLSSFNTWHKIKYLRGFCIELFPIFIGRQKELGVYDLKVKRSCACLRRYYECLFQLDVFLYVTHFSESMCLNENNHDIVFLCILIIIKKQNSTFKKMDYFIAFVLI